jgi:hypothetical protein
MFRLREFLFSTVLGFGHQKWAMLPYKRACFCSMPTNFKVAGTTDKASLENQAWVGRPAAAVEVKYANYTSPLKLAGLNIWHRQDWIIKKEQRTILLKETFKRYWRVRHIDRHFF